jgi:DNA (cytosine-5)-methyltransferase 1
VRGNPAPRREAGAGVAASLTNGSGTRGWNVNAENAAGNHLIPEVACSVHQNADGEVRTYDTSNTLNTNSNATGRNAPIVMAPAFSKRPGQQIATKEDGGCFALTTGEPPRVLAVRTAQTSANGHGIAENVAHTLDLAQGQAVAFSAGNSGDAYGIGLSVEHTPPLRAAESGTNQVPTIQHGYAVRRLTPLECERLQGFPDGWTQVPYRGKQASDGPRYKAIGNSMAVNVMRFIGERIEAVRQNAPATCEGVQACDDVQHQGQEAR